MLTMRTHRLISATDGNLPNKPCQTCKNSFHASCLYEVRVLSVRPMFPDRRSADSRPASSGSRAVTPRVALCVVPTLLNRRKVWVYAAVKGYVCTYCVTKRPS